MARPFRVLRRFFFAATSVLVTVGCGDSAIPVTRDDPVEGQRDALVTVVAFGDYQCPYTAQAIRTVEGLRERYSPGELRIAWKHLPLSFHAAAGPAAESAAVVNVLAGAEPFWSLSRRMLDSQREMTTAAVDDWVSELGVRVDEYRALVSQGVGAAKVDADLALASSLAVHAAPTFFVNGVEIEGALPAEAMAAIIDRALAQARDELAAGVDRAELYDTITRLNRASTKGFAGPDG
jgi:protein-disulfide isomerase